MTEFVVVRGADRSVTRTSGLSSAHSFSFGSFYDPSNVGFGLLLAHNEDLIAPGSGYDTHPHRDVEIVTWVLSGSLAHVDSLGHQTVVSAGSVQWTGAGSGITHSEFNASSSEPLHLVQMWLPPDHSGLTPDYATADLGSRSFRSPTARCGSLVPAASGIAPSSGAPIRIRQSAAGFYVASIATGESLVVPSAPFRHVLVASGVVDVSGVGRLNMGDALRVTGGDDVAASAVESAELLVWEMHRTLY